MRLLHGVSLVAALLALAGVPAAGQEPAPGPTIVSQAPASVAVTVYRAPGRAPGGAMSLAWLGGFALVTEQRDIDLPAGPAILRFEGVAAGMLAESAILTGLPEGVREKNLDAELLSPRNLYARAFGRPVVLRRRHPGSGEIEEEPAIIRSGPDGAAVVQTGAGFEMVNCGGLKDSIAYQGLPAGLNSRPTLSMATQAPVARHLRVTLSYLAWGFDWNAHYVLRLAPGARSATLTAWLTLASGDDTSFADATTAVVAGKLNFDETRAWRSEGGALRLDCGVTQAAPAPPPPPPPVSPVAAPMQIMVSAARMMKADYVAREEALGDLHLYRLPMATTLDAHAQKQVALLAERPVKLALIHTATITPDDEVEARVAVRLRNRREDGLGLALPGGRVSVVQPLAGGAMLPAGEGTMGDKAEGETVDVTLAAAPQVRVVSVSTMLSAGRRRVLVTVTNANRWPVRFEGKLQPGEGVALLAASARLGRKDGALLWATAVPAQGRVTLSYTLADKAR